MIHAAGRQSSLGLSVLDHAKDDRADKGERDIRGDNAQSAHEGIHEGHSEISGVRVADPCNAEDSDAFRPNKSALLPLAPSRPPATWLKIREINALKSP
jgi:hypothetical protein